MMIQTEQLLISRDGFGIVTATPAQRAACRILDGRPLADLADHPDVLALIGGADALTSLPSERGLQPQELVFLAAIRSAKTIIACAAALRATQTVDVSKLGPGEVPRVSLISLRLDQAAVAHGLLLETMRVSKVLRALLLEESADSLLVRHPSGRAIEIATVAGSKAGGTLVARWSAGLIADEAPRMSGADDAVVNLDDARTAILGRLLPGAQALYIGSPWAPYGPVYELVDQHWAKPTDHMVVLRGTGPALNPSWWTPARCARLEAQDATAYRTDVLGEFADPESGLLNPVAVYRSTRDRPLDLPREEGAFYFAAVDPAEGAATANAWSLVVVQRLLEERPATEETPSCQVSRFRVALVREWRGLSPARCWSEIAEACRVYGISSVRTDQYAASANADLARLVGLTLEVDRTTGPSKLEDFTNLATLLHNDRIELSPDPVLRRDLLSVKKRVTQAGATIVLPRTSDGRHCDSAPALCAAVKQATHSNCFVKFEFTPVLDHRHRDPARRSHLDNLYAPDDDDDSDHGGQYGGCF